MYTVRLAIFAAGRSLARQFWSQKSILTARQPARPAGSGARVGGSRPGARAQPASRLTMSHGHPPADSFGPCGFLVNGNPQPKLELDRTESRFAGAIGIPTILLDQNVSNVRY